jgi:hypothetical protein
MPKTATKTLQRRLFAHHSDICYLGRFPEVDYPEWFRRHWACRSEAIGSVMRMIHFRRLHAPDIERCRSALRDVLASAASCNQVPVFSWESLSTDALHRRRLRARNLRAVLGEATVLVCLRNPIALIESAYFLYLHRSNLNPHYSRWRPPHFRTIDQWLEQSYESEVRPHLQYADTVRAYARFFGLHNVHVMLFEDLHADAQRFYRRLCDVIGICAEEALGLVANRSDNKRFSAAQVDRIRELSRSPLQSLVFACTPPELRASRFGITQGSPLVPGEAKARAQMSPEWRQRLFDETRDGTMWLKSVYPLDFDGYGYLSPAR